MCGDDSEGIMNEGEGIIEYTKRVLDVELNECIMGKKMKVKD